MQDAYNLGWKIGLVVKGVAQRSILKTYQSERRRVAQDLIEFDHRFSRLFSGKPAKDLMDESGVSMAEFKDAFLKGNLFACGLSVDYSASTLVAKGGSSAEQGDGAIGSQVIGKQELAANIKLGMRMPSFKVLNQSDARPWHLQELLKSDSRFRIILFAGNVTSAVQKTRIEKFCAKLNAPGSFLRRFTPASRPIDSVIEILTLHSAKRWDVEMLRDFPDLLHPFDKHVGWDYNKIYVDDESYHEGNGRAYENYGVDKEKGCVVVLRPDQHVGYIGEIEDVEDLGTYFDGVMVEASGHNK